MIKWAIIIGFAGVLLVVGIVIMMFATGSDDDCSDDSDSTTATASTGISGDWATPGTVSYNNAKSVWDAWVSHGFDGAATSGILGNIAHEGGFSIPDRAQGHFGDDEATNGVSAGVDPIADTEQHKGAGLYQFTYFKKYADLGDSKWLDIGAQTDFAWSSEISKFIDNCPYNVGGYGVGSYRAYSQLTDPDAAAKAWFSMYERGAAYNSAKSASAQQAYMLFDGASVSADPTKLGTDAAALHGMATDLDDQSGTCGDESDESDGTGTHSEAVGANWSTYDELPDDVKKYAHDPSKLLGDRGNGAKWTELGCSATSANQCVGFSVAYGNAIWGLTGNKMGNGIDTAKGFASQTQTELIDSPKAGAIVSQDGYGNGASAGHTFIIQHVYENGDVLVAEQNWSTSGETAGEMYTWDFRIESAPNLKEHHAVYAYPGNNAQYKLKWE